MYFKLNPNLIFNKDKSISNLSTRKRIDTPADFQISLVNLPKTFTALEFEQLFAGNSTGKTFNRLVDLSIIIPQDKIFNNKEFIKNINIEICTHCNLRCNYCPVSLSPLNSDYMPNSLFEQIIKIISPLDLEWISLNHYNEPFLDRTIIDKLNIIKNYNLKCQLFTNGTLILPEMTDTIYKNNLCDKIIINLPSLDSDEYLQITKRKLSEQKYSNLLYLLKSKIPKEICVNGDFDEKEYRYSGICNFLKENNLDIIIYKNRTNSRAGLLANYELSKNNYEYLGGCKRFIEQMNIGIDGTVFICCQDFNKKYIFGNVFENSLDEIYNGIAYSKLFSQIFGHETAESDFICRNCSELNPSFSKS